MDGHSNERDTFGTLRGELDLAKDALAWAALGARKGDESNILAAPTVSNSNGAPACTASTTSARHVRTGEIGVRGKLRTGPVKP
jgi:iron complex outermembrane receptor protein